MQTCPKCSSAKIETSGTTCWTQRCENCGFSESGTASFPLDVEVEHEYDLIFQLSSPSQIPVIRAIMPELLSQSTAELLEAYRMNSARITVSALAMWRARDYMRKAALEGIQAHLSNEN
jgi:hypothetical protein